MTDFEIGVCIMLFANLFGVFSLFSLVGNVIETSFNDFKDQHEVNLTLIEMIRSKNKEGEQ